VKAGGSPIPLGAGTLAAVAAAGVPVPSYDRRGVTAGIVHIGVGGFSRSHQAMYLDRLMDAGVAGEWGICGVGLRAEDRRMKEVLTAQDHLYTLLVKHRDGRVEPRVIGSLVEYLWGPDDLEAIAEKLAGPAIRIVSLTITGDGYGPDPPTGADDGRRTSAAGGFRSGLPGSASGVLAEGLRRRRGRGLAPFTVLSCDNLRDNGTVARRSVTGIAALVDPGLAEWIQDDVSFPSTVVDRITPATTADDVTMLEERWGVADAWPVACEPFAQWIVEDRFIAGRPPIESAGALLVDDVGPYEQMKLGLLNGGHQAIAYFGRLAGHRYVHDAVRDPLLAAFVRSYLDDEVSPSLRPVPGVDLGDYKRTLLDRFSNAGLADTVARLCDPTPTMLAKYVLPVVRARLACGGEVRRAAAIVAAWARLDELRSDPSSGRDPRDHLSPHAVFDDLRNDVRFVGPYADALISLRESGPRAVLAGLESEGTRGTRHG
jgi:mannitol 2-dehydrogenase